MFLHKNVGFFSQLPILFFRQVTVISTITYQNDPYLNYVVLNINGDTALSGNNNTFLDSGFRNISATGNVTQGTFSPFSPAGWSGYFDGSSYLTTPWNSSLTFGTGDFTVECWVNVIASGFICGIWNDTTAAAQSWLLGIDTSSGPYFVINNTSSWEDRIKTTSTAISTNSWYHLAVTRSGNNWYMFLNGALMVTNAAVKTIQAGSNLFTIGRRDYPVGGGFTGYVSNLRIIKGTALYTSSFTPNSAEQTKLLPNTSILTLQDNRFVDNSRNNFTLSATGTPQTQPFSPIAPAVDYTPSLHGGSGYFDGSSRLNALSSNALLFDGDLTIEAWIYITTTVPGPGMTIYGTSGAGGDDQLTITSSRQIYYAGFTTTQTPAPINLNRWYHVAAVRNSTNVKIYVDGIEVGSTTKSVNIGSSSVGPAIGNRAGDNGTPFTGYISNLRVVKGQAVYTSNFTPPSRPVTATSNGGASVGTTAVPNLSVTPSLLLDFDNGGIIDRSYKNDALVFGDAKTQTLSSKFGTGSLYFDGTGDYLEIPSNKNLTLSGDFTIEFWMSPLAIGGGTFRRILTTTSGAGGTGDWWVRTQGTGVINAVGNVTGTTVLSINTWYHIAVTRTSGIIKLFVNGTKEGTDVTSTISYNTIRFIGGLYTVTGEYHNGYLEDLRITNGVARYTGASFTPPSKLQANNSDPYYSNVVLFLDGNNIGSNVNNEFRATAGDAARLAITRTGATQGSFSPYSPNGWSGYFDASSWLSVTNSQFAFGTNNWTVEFWIYPFSYGGITAGGQIFGTVNGSKVGYSIHIGQGKDLFRLTSNATGTWADNITVSTGGGPELYTWSHMVVCRNGSTLNIFKNGNIVATTTITTFNMTGTTAIIGRFNEGTAVRNFNGNISNLRVINGQALYTSNFTPPTEPLPALSGSGFSTSLLTLQDNRFKDNSPNNLTISVAAGTPSVQAFNPYKQTTAYSPTLHGGSGYFDGSSYLTVPANQGFNLTGDFTIECWVNTSVFSLDTNTRHLISMGTGGDAVNLLKVSLLTTAGAASNVISLYTTSAILVGNIVVADGRWHHIAVTRSGTNLRLYVDGVQSGSTTTTSPSFNAGATTNIQIGRHNNAVTGRWNGYISNLRIVKGRALYTSNFTPPTSPVTAVNGTSLLLNFDNGYAIDSTGNNVITTVGDSRTDVLSTAPLSSSTGSLYFDGTGDYLAIPPSDTLNLATGNFTVEAWVNTNNIGGTSSSLAIARTALSIVDSNSLQYSIYRIGSNLYVRAYQGTSDYNINVGTIAANTWYHVSLVRSGDTFSGYLNGVKAATTRIVTGALNNNSSWNGVMIGGTNEYAGTDGPWNGYIDDLRITKGVARYTSNFTPQTYENQTSNILTYPTDPFRNYVILDLNADAVNNEQNNTFLDRSGNNLTITRSGSTTQGSFSPFSPAGWSGYFNGSTDYLTIPANQGFNLTGDFTIEFWINTTVYSADTNVRHILSLGTGADNLNLLKIFLGTSGGAVSDKIQVFSGTIGYTGIASKVVADGSWHHVAVTRENNQLKTFIDGTQDGTTATTTQAFSAGATSNIYISRINLGETGRINGYISNLRIVKGQALYTNTFTPPTAALTTTSTVGGVTLSAENVSLLTLQDNRFKDNSNNNFTITPNGTPSVKPFSPFQPTATYSPTVHGGSGYFNGNSVLKDIPNTNNVFSFGNGDYTIEGYVNCSTGGRIVYFSDNTTLLDVDGTDKNIYLFDGSVRKFGKIEFNTWNHFSVNRKSGIVYCFLNGKLGYTAPETSNTTTRTLTIGGSNATPINTPITGYISNLRIVKGVAITPPVGGPTAPVQAVSGTSLLLNFDNAGVVDSTGKNNVTTYSTSKVDYVNEKYGSGALKFNGTSDYMQVGTASDWTFLHSPSAKWTIEFWVYSNISTSRYLLDTANDNATSNAGIGIQKDASNKIRCYIARAAATLVLDATSTPTVPLSTWTHVAITYDHSLASNNMVMYFNGLSSNVFSKTVNTPSTNNPANALSIGCNGNGTGNFFDGSIDELRITNAVRYTGNFSVSSYTLPLSS